jgi:hypothetical protein
MQTNTAQKLRAGGCTLYFDTNAIRGRSATNVGAFNHFCKQIKRLRTYDMNAPRVCVFSVIYFEMAHQLRREIANFDDAIITASLKTNDVDIVALDGVTAQSCARELHGWFPSHQQWQDAKKSANDKATIDWLISTHIAANNSVLVSDDSGVEFQPLRATHQIISSGNVNVLLNQWLTELS